MKHTYALDGARILKETWGTHTLVPLYDNEDSVCGIIYDGTAYYFYKNLQGDVIAIVDKDAQTVARYSYDAWGVPTIKSDTSGCSLATVNPFRYRGYYYDTENKIYYLHSRYYDVAVGRFLNSDAHDFLGFNDNPIVNNLYTYCMNSPTIYHDDDGTIATEIGLGLIGAIICGALLLLVVSLMAYRFLQTILEMLYRRQSQRPNSLYPLIQMMILITISRIQTSIKKITASLKTFEEELSGLVEAVLRTYNKAKRRKKGTSHWHHIVAKSAAAAFLARSVLYANHLDPNNPFNLVLISQRLHSGLHTAEYYIAVNALFMSTYKMNRTARVGYIYALWINIAIFLTAVDISLNQ